MTKPTITIHNCETGEIINREMNDDELAQHQADQLAAQVEAQAKLTKAAEKAALLEKLGISEDEAKLLLS
jgi:hypothetical protein